MAAVVLGAGVACAEDRENTSIDPNTVGAEDGDEMVWHRAALGSVSAYVLVRGKQAAIVDTGLSGSEDEIGNAVKAAGLEWADVRHVIVTHKHPDHAGSLAAVLAAATNAKVSAGEAEIAAIQSPRPLEAVTDGADVFGLQIVATPGHTPGHISVFDAGSHVLVTGDAVVGSGADVKGPNPQYTEDMAKAHASAKKLAALDVDTILFGHGEPIKGGGRQALENFVKTLG